MNAPVNKNLIDAAEPAVIEAPAEPKRPRGRWLMAGVALILFLIALATLVAWLLRRTLAENAIQDWCNAQGLTCAGSAERVGPRAIRLTGVNAKRGDADVFAADAIEARLSWTSPFSARPSLIVVEKPVLRGKLDESGVTFSGLEKLLDRPSTGAAPPALDIRAARLLLDTPFGTLAANADVKGSFPNDAVIEASLDKGLIKGARGSADVEAATISLKADKGVLKGDALINATLDAGDALKAEGANFKIGLSLPLDKSAPLALDWSGEAVALTTKALYAEKLVSSGSAKFSKRPSGSVSDMLAALTDIETKTRAAFAKRDDMTFQGAALNAKTKRGEQGLTGPLDFALGGLSAPAFSASAMNADGRIGIASAEAFAFTGDMTLSGSKLGDSAQDSVVRAFALPDMLASHQQAGRAALGRALSDFSLAAPVNIAVNKNKLRLEAAGTTQMKAASGLKLTLSPVAEGENLPVFTLDGQTRRIEATLDLTGGGLPDTQLEAATLLSTGSDFDLAAASAKIAPWRLGEQSVGGSTGPITVRLEGKTLEAETIGTLQAAGKFAGLAFKPTDIAFAIETTRTDGRWRARSPDGSCLNVDSAGFVFGTIAAGAFTAKACGAGGYLLDPNSKTLRGTFDLDDFALPFSTSNTTGTLQLANGALKFTGGKQTQIELTGDTLGLPMRIEARTLSVDALSPQLKFITTSGAPEIVLALGETKFSGTMVPANVSAGTVVFSGTAPKAGLEGALDAGAIRVTDNRDDPLYQPLLADFKGRLSEDRLKGAAPIRLAAQGTEIATAVVDLDYLKLNGAIDVDTRELAFVPGGLQPVMLTEQLRGVFTDAGGSLKASADIAVTSGKMAGTADVALGDFGFQTQRFGRVEDVDGTVRFSDVFKLTTEKNQRVTIGAMNPGVPLTNGEFFFGLSDGKTIRIAGGAFPFAGGRIELGPIDWTSGDKNQNVEIKVINVDLAQLVETLKIPDLKASGTMSGAFPLRIEGQKMLVQNARLTADKAGGKLIYEGKVLDNYATSPEMQMANGALRNFDYQVIELGLDGDLAGKAKITARIVGSNATEVSAGPRRTLMPGQTFDLALTFNSELGHLLNMAGQKYVLEQAKTQIAEEIRRDDAPAPQSE